MPVSETQFEAVLRGRVVASEAAVNSLWSRINSDEFKGFSGEQKKQVYQELENIYLDLERDLEALSSTPLTAEQQLDFVKCCVALAGFEQDKFKKTKLLLEQQTNLEAIQIPTNSNATENKQAQIKNSILEAFDLDGINIANSYANIAQIIIDAATGFVSMLNENNSDEQLSEQRRKLLIAEVLANLSSSFDLSIKAQILRGRVELASKDKSVNAAGKATLQAAVAAATKNTNAKSSDADDIKKERIALEIDARIYFAEASYSELLSELAENPEESQKGNIGKLKSHLETSLGRHSIMSQYDKGDDLIRKLKNFYQTAYVKIFSAFKNKQYPEVIKLANTFRLMTERKSMFRLTATYLTYSNIPEVVEYRELAKALSAYANCLMGVYPEHRAADMKNSNGSQKDGRDYFNDAKENLADMSYFSHFPNTAKTDKLRTELMPSINHHLKTASDDDSIGMGDCRDSMVLTTLGRSPSLERMAKDQLNTMLNNVQYPKQETQSMPEASGALLALDSLDTQQSKEQEGKFGPETNGATESSSVFHETLTVLDSMKTLLRESVSETKLSPERNESIKKKVVMSPTRFAQQLKEATRNQPPVPGSLTTKMGMFSKGSSGNKNTGISSTQLFIDSR